MDQNADQERYQELSETALLFMCIGGTLGIGGMTILMFLTPKAYFVGAVLTVIFSVAGLYAWYEYTDGDWLLSELEQAGDSA